MPIYEYRCSECGFEKDALQKMSDPPLVDCPNCGKPALVKLVSAAGFQLKGSGWYVTDFKSSGTKPAAGKGAAKDEGADKAKSGEGAKADSASGEAKSGEAKSADTPAASESPKSSTSGPGD